MIPILFDTAETNFTSNGIGRLVDCISCTVTEERNGIYECEFQYPITGRLYDELLIGGTIGVIHDDNHDIQPFDIYDNTGNIDGIVTFRARHISYRQSNIVVGFIAAYGASGALAAVKSESFNTNPFTYTTDIPGTSIRYTPGTNGEVAFRSARGFLMGEEGSILDVFGGEYKFDKWTVSLLKARGRDTGVTIRHGKNLVGIEWTLDKSNLFNAIAPFTYDGVGTGYVGGGETIVTPTTPITPIVPVVMDVSQLITEPWSADKMVAYARQYLDSNRPWVPKASITVDFVAMWQAEEYAEVANIQRIQLCDTVSIYWPEMGIVEEKAKVIRTVYNVLTERLDSIEVGQPQSTYLAVTENPTGQVDDTTKMYTNPLLDVKSIPTTATSYSASWKGYNLLLVCAKFYSNVVASILVPSEYFDDTNSTRRIQITDPLNNRRYDVYKDGDSAIYIAGSAAAGSMYGVAVYGIIV